ncbi:MAG: hypothetical protein EA353_13195 [Puniceicoccaceae bacterium]|nr:MAG: hypothetical protein EA353_13195 [Puniceicoccaceae bacterium]
MALLCALPLFAEERATPFSLSVGTQSIGVRYQFTDESALVESAHQILDLGSDTLKIAITPKYDDDYLLEVDPEIQSINDLMRKEPDYFRVMDMPFRNVMLWVYPFSDTHAAFRTGTIEEAEAEAIYQEIYEFTVSLLERYSGSGKSFFLGNWEGDWHLLLENYDYNLDPTPEAIEGAIKWFNLREKAIADARRDTPHDNVAIFHYVELNHVGKSMDDGRPTIVNKVLPYIRADYVSWSSYDVTKPAARMSEEEGRKRVHKALDFIEAHLPESDVQGKRVFLGEYGFELSSFKGVQVQKRHTVAIMKWALEWGCPFILYWELYCNETEPSTGEHLGYWLIDDQGQKQPILYFHKEFLSKANQFVDAYKAEHGTLPSQETYNQAAVKWIESFSTYNVRVDDHRIYREGRDR